jgi:hypothetical protein
MSQKPDPAKLILYAFCKKWARGENTAETVTNGDDDEYSRPATKPEPPEVPAGASAALPALLALFSYTHRPGRSGAHGPAG